MSDILETAELRQEALSYDLERTLSAIVSVRTQIPEDALTAKIPVSYTHLTLPTTPYV